MSDWSKSIAKRFSEGARAQKEKEERENAKTLDRDRKVLLDAETLKLNSPQMWEDLRECFETKCKEFNSEGTGTTITLSKPDPNTLTVVRTPDSPMKLTLIFDTERHSIKLRSPYIGKLDRIDIKVKPGTSELAFYAPNLVSKERVVEAVLEMLLGLGLG